MAENAKVGGNGNGGNDEIVERSPFKKPSKYTEYLIFLYSNADSAFFEKR